MTISLAWVRKLGNLEELVLATDSRLSFGCRWDCCPKLMALPRNDSAICFAGDTLYAYPILIQFLNVIDQHPKIKSRAMDIVDAKGHMIRVMNNMTSRVYDHPIGVDKAPESTFLLAGWSWRSARYFAWLLHYDIEINRFTFRSSRKWSGKTNEKFLAFTGDYEEEFKARLITLLRSKDKFADGGFDMEPFEVLRDMLRSNQFPLIGAAPQIMKVYRHANCMPYAVYWPSKESREVSLMGRPLLDYERTSYLVMDPDTLKTGKHTGIA